MQRVKGVFLWTDNPLFSKKSEPTGHCLFPAPFTAHILPEKVRSSSIIGTTKRKSYTFPAVNFVWRSIWNPFQSDRNASILSIPASLHGIIAEMADNHWEDAVVFSPGILNFDSYDEAQIRLVKPIQNGNLLFPRCITPMHPAFSPMRNAFSDIMHAFGPIAEDSVSDSILITDDLTSQLYIKSSLLYMLATLSAHRLFTPAGKNFDKRVESIKTALTYMKDHYHEKIYLSELAGLVNLNEQYFCRLFKKAIGCSPITYLNEYRVKQAKRLLEKTDLSVTEVCLECGYSNLGNFLREFRRYTGNTPLQYRKHFGDAMS